MSLVQAVLRHPGLAKAAGSLKPARVVSLAGVWGACAPLAAGALASSCGRTMLYICPHLDDADDAADNMELLTGIEPMLFPAWEADVSGERISDEIAAQRMKVCSALQNASAGGPRVVIAPVAALLQPVPDAECLSEGRLTLRGGDEQSMEGLMDWLVAAGFERVEMVEQMGEFATRGGIMDIFAPCSVDAVRVEFFGDQIESIRTLDLDNQRSGNQLAGFEIVSADPGREIDPTRTTHLLSYLADGDVVCLSDALEVPDMANIFFQRLADPTGMFRPESLFKSFNRFRAIEMYPFGSSAPEAVDLAVDSLQRLSVGADEALDLVVELAGNTDLTVFCENGAERDRFAEMLTSKFGSEIASRVHLELGRLIGSFSWPAEKLTLLAHHEIFRRHTLKRRLRRVRSGRPIDSFIDLQEGDYVVHVAHGIARFEGLRHLEKDGVREEFLTLRFAKNAALHVPVAQIGLVQKYIGAAATRPTLSTLGSASWARQKQRVADAVKDMAAELLRIQAMREHSRGIAFPLDTEWQRRFEQEFPYEETEDQLISLKEIKADQQQPRPMDRLLCGDVGFGKTELAVRAAFKAVEAGKQVAVLCPTTVLAAQHFRTFSERMADYPFVVDVVSRFRKPADQRAIAKKLVLGDIDVLIGTHRLLSEDMRFADLGLVIIDEEQRFGVAHKERFKTMRAEVDILTLSATPIPRTLHMSLMGLRDISNLHTPPLDRRAIHTEVRRYDEHIIGSAIKRELAREGQIFYLHNRVHSIEATAAKIQAIVPEARIAIGHGQMPPRRLERIMLDFIHGVYDVLVCTTIIESGLDIPTVNTMIIDNADRFGLAELHQLRGRVGRYMRQAYCYLLLPENRSLSPVAARRLKAVEEFSDLGAGFQIAMRDLEIRGAGNILGSEQSGHIAAVGYDMYCQLLDEAARALSGRKPEPRRDVNIDLGISAYIPKRYIPAERQRMEVYRRLSRCQKPEELAQLIEDIRDSYGRPPAALDTLATLAEIRILGGALGIHSIVLMRPDIIFSIRNWKLCKNLFKDASGTVRMPDEKTVHWRLPENYLEEPTMLAVITNLLRRALPADKRAGVAASALK